ncbi:hypothetical protein Fmac_005224 [Flemingia macrophylla]|uniref:Uncharacterized protein n=1 Tax=Flemingia macrophylla TaxID=520843 RepID=A0ABD1N771_9FABA
MVTLKTLLGFVFFMKVVVMDVIFLMELESLKKDIYIASYDQNSEFISKLSNMLWVIDYNML